MKRVLVVGTSGCGKSTLAAKIAQRLGITFHASDHFYWQSDWRPAPLEHVNALLDEVLRESEWVLDGNFEHRWREVWGRADCIVWLDYSFATIMRQLLARNIRWLCSGEVIWSGNRMTLGRVLSGIRHSVKSYPHKRETYPQYIAALKGVSVLRFTKRAECEKWLQSLVPAATGASPLNSGGSDVVT